MLFFDVFILWKERRMSNSSDNEIKNLKKELKKVNSRLLYAYDTIDQLKNKIDVLEVDYKESKESWIADINNIQEEANMKIHDAEYKYKRLQYETNSLSRLRCVYSKYIHDLESLLKNNNISFANERGEYDDALNEVYSN